MTNPFTEANTVEQMILDAIAVGAHGLPAAAVAHRGAANRRMKTGPDGRRPPLRGASHALD